MLGNSSRYYGALEFSAACPCQRFRRTSEIRSTVTPQACRSSRILSANAACSAVSQRVSAAMHTSSVPICSERTPTAAERGPRAEVFRGNHVCRKTVVRREKQPTQQPHVMVQRQPGNPDRFAMAGKSISLSCVIMAARGRLVLPLVNCRKAIP